MAQLMAINSFITLAPGGRNWQLICPNGATIGFGM